MQTLYYNEDKRYNSKRVGVVGSIIYVRRTSRYMERECNRGPEELNFGIEEFLIDLKKEFSSRDDEIMKVAELEKIEQRNKTIKEFVQQFRKIARESGYKKGLLIKKFKREMNRLIRKKLMEVERLSRSIKQ